MFSIGVDEVGRGPLAGPVVVCAVRTNDGILSKFSKLKDSKKMTEKDRVDIFDMVNSLEIEYGIGVVSAKDIDREGIVKSIDIAVGKALGEVKHIKDMVFLDGLLKAPECYKRQETIIKGDEKNKYISLASVIAKVFRDNLMVKEGEKYIEYKFGKNKGYGTKEHIEAIAKYGVSPIHRKTFLKKIHNNFN